MPKIAEKVSILNGRGSVISYSNGSSAGSYFYRELIKGTSRYIHKKIDDAETIDEAVGKAIDIAFKLQQEQDELKGFSSLLTSENPDATSSSGKPYLRSTLANNNRKAPKKLVELAIEDWIAREQRRVDAGLLEPETLGAKANVLKKHLLPYLGMRGVSYTNQINLNTFIDYEIHRSSTTPLNRNQEVMMIKDFIRNYCVREKLVPPDLLLDKNFIKRSVVRKTDRMKNPAINEEDFTIIRNFIKGEWKQRVLSLPNYRSHYWRELFYRFVLFAKNTGMSGEEILKMKWKQIDIISEERLRSDGTKERWEVAYVSTIRGKTKEPREIPTNQAKSLQTWKTYQQDYINKHNIKVEVTKDSYVFGNPSNDLLPLRYSQFGFAWREIRDELKPRLNGHRFSEHPYTLYSLRSTFIEHHLLNGTDLLDVADMAGHSVKMTQEHYAKLNLREKGTELSRSGFGKKKLDKFKVNLFLNNDEDETHTTTNRTSEKND